MPHLLRLFNGEIMKKITFTVTLLLACTLLILLLNHNSIGYCSDDKPTHLVDKRVELVSLVFRLAGVGVEPREITDYQMALSNNFEHLRDHPVVTFSRHMFYPSGGPVLITNLLKFDKGMISLNARLLDSPCFAVLDLFTMETFVDFLNCFYVESEFGQFFLDHYEYFRCHSERFISLVYDYLNYNWFLEYGLYEHNMNIILSPGLNADVDGLSTYFVDPDSGETIVYAIISTSDEYTLWGHLGLLIHEFVHSFADHIAYNWFWENNDFRELMIRTFANNSYHHLYMNPLQLAKEYVTEAFTILYLVENTTMSLERLLYWRYLNGKTYIQEIYSMVTKHNHIIFPNILTKSDLNLPEYTLSDVTSYIINENHEITVQFLFFEQQLDFTSYLIPNWTVRDQFGSTTNDIFYLYSDGSRILIIDLGCGIQEGFSYGQRLAFWIDVTEN